ncbi:hypothetical protein HMPREF1581_00935 [Gardnerella vaginalis JCP8108]|uniref:Uncharacterized protein n=1 Tax=Gardnerella vaginalis JCP8108 TaxID=1261066 RepID=S4GEZ2_GARVA|nr:hypothetical protein HMPREF1581_00935 [Gardnerella vaginalis JCP8108]
MDSIWRVLQRVFQRIFGVSHIFYSAQMYQNCCVKETVLIRA